jgi:hypothetical protein
MANSNPWWMDDPELIALRDRALEELERGIDEYEPNSGDEPDLVVAEIYSGEASRALSGCTRRSGGRPPAIPRRRVKAASAPPIPGAAR